MYLASIRHAVPDCRFTQPEAWDRFANSPAAKTLSPKARHLMKRVMTGENGIEARHYALPPTPELFAKDAQGLNEAFEVEAPKLANQALESALTSGSFSPGEIDALFVCTCTGYLCPGLSSYISEAIGLSPHAYLQDIVGQGCGAAIPTLQSAANYLAANPEATIAVIAVEICSAAYFVNDDPGVLISAALFGDGASASIWTAKENGRINRRLSNFDTIHLPKKRELLRFKNENGRLRNVLSPAVPKAAAEAVNQLYQRSGCTASTPIVAHPGGKEVLKALARQLPTPPHKVSADILRDFGNMSSPSVLFALEAYLNEETDQSKPIWLTSFGAGMTAHSATLHASSNV